MFVSVIGCDVAVEPNVCKGKVRSAGDSVIGCWQGLELPTARQMYPTSSKLPLLLLRQAFVFTTYPVPTECRTDPLVVESKVTGYAPLPPKLTSLAGTPI